MGELFKNKVSKTMLMTLQAKALEGGQKNRLFMDQKAEEMGSLSNRVDETILVKELSSVRLLNSFFSCWSK